MSIYNMIATGYTQLTGYANAAALNSAASAIHYDGYKVAVADVAVFYLNKESTATPDNTTVIAALDGGNWLEWTSPYVLLDSDNVIDAAQFGTVASLGDGSATSPALAFASDTNTGIYKVGSHDFGISTNGTLRFDISTTAVTSTLPYVAPVGSAAAPAYTFASDTDTGLYHVSANAVGVTGNGVLILTIAPTAVTFATGAQLVVPSGTAAAPNIAMGGEQTGPYLISAGNLGVAIAGALKVTVSATQMLLASGLQLNMPASSAAAPAFTVGAEQTGAYLISAGNLGLATAGVLRATLSSTQLLLATGVNMVMGAARLQVSAGVSVASANNLTLGGDGNMFNITAATQINLLDSTGWQTGSIVYLNFASNPTIKYNQGVSTTFKPIILSGHADITTLTANSTLTLQYNGTVWLELARCIV